MNGRNAPFGGPSNGGSPPMPFYRGAYESKMRGDQVREDASTGNRYVPPHLRGHDIVRPESSISNASNNTFASQIPGGNYSYGPTHLTSSIASYQPFSNGPAPSRNSTQLPPSMGGSTSLRGAAPTFDRATEGSNIGTRSGAPPSHGHGARGFRGPNQQDGSSITSYTSGQRTSYPSAIAQPTPSRRDSGAGAQSRAEYLASRIMQGHADDPFDPDFGNPGPTRRPPPPPQPIPFPSFKSPSENPKLPVVYGKQVPENVEGNTMPYLDSKKVSLPPWFAAATEAHQLPTLEQAFASLPFIEAGRYAIPSTAGVVKVAGIPYSTSRAEVNAFLGKNVQICYQPIGAGFQAVHIIMDRHSGKTMDAFVEVATHTEAIWVVNQFMKRVVERRPARVGGRVVDVQLSDQSELMRIVFPRAKQTAWENGVPKIDPSKEEFYPGIWSEGFKGFLQDEEIAHMYQHSEKPQRSPFVTRCMVRHYEYLITTLYKFPWYDIENVRLEERDRLFDATLASLETLIALLRRISGDKPDASKPTVNTLTELAMAIFVCPGFSDRQKSRVAASLQLNGFGKLTDDRALNLRFGGISNLAKHVPFRALTIKPGVDSKVLDFFANILSDATMKPLSLADIHAMNASVGGIESKKFGNLHADYSGCKTLADAGRAELRYLERVLGTVLLRGGSSRVGSGLGSWVSSFKLPS